MSELPSPDFDDAEADADPETATADEAERVEVAVIAPAAPYETIDTIRGMVQAEAEAGLPPIEEGPETSATADAQDAGPEPDRLEAVLEAVARVGQELGGRIDRLEAQFERELRAESSREKVVDRLHAELQEYKNDLLLKVTRPIFIDLIQLHDDMGKMAETLGEERAAGILRDFQQGIEDVLYRQGVEPFRVEGEAFDPRRQRAVSTVATEEPERNKSIAGRLRQGFQVGDRVIRPELVSVFALKRVPSDGDEAGAS